MSVDLERRNWLKKFGLISATGLIASCAKTSLAGGSTEVPSHPYVINVKDYGATGDGSTDDTAAIQAAINAARSSDGGNAKSSVFLPGGTYKISATLSFRLQFSLNLIGEGPRVSRLVWVGATDGTMLAIEGVREARFQGFSLVGNGSTTAIKYDGVNGLVTMPSTDNVFEEIMIEGNHAYGIRIGQDAFQSDQTNYRRCEFWHCSNAGVSIEDANAVLHDFYECSWQYDGKGVTAILQGTGGSFNLYGCGFNGNSDVDIGVFPSSRGTAIVGTWSENSTRFLEVKSGSTATTVSLVECSVNTMRDPQGRMVVFGSSGSLNVIGGKYFSGLQTPCQIYIGANNGTRTNINIIGSVFEGDPFQAVPHNNIQYASVILTGVQMNRVFDKTSPAEISGPLLKGSKLSPLSLGTQLYWAPGAWLRIPAGTSLVPGDTSFPGYSWNCQGNTTIVIDSLQSSALSAPVQIRGEDTGNGTFTILVTSSLAQTLANDLDLRVLFHPESVSL